MIGIDQSTKLTDHQGVFVNGVDQGLFKGIRTPAFNGAPNGGGYSNSPVKNLTSIDMPCNVLGDIPAPDTITVAPGDNLTFDWYVTDTFLILRCDVLIEMQAP